MNEFERDALIRNAIIELQAAERDLKPTSFNAGVLAGLSRVKRTRKSLEALLETKKK